MGLKGVLLEDHIPLSNYELAIAGIVPIIFTSVGAIELELDTVDLPDRTKASGGRTKPGEIEVKVPLHHVVEIAAMDTWLEEGQDPVLPTYKKVGTLSGLSLSGLITQTFTMIGLFNRKKMTPEFVMENDGELSENTYSLSWDDIL